MKSLKLSLLAAASASFLLASTAGMAANYKGESAGYKGEVPCPQPLTLKDGFYLGAQVGYDSYRVRHNTTFSDSDGDTFTSNPALNATGFVGGLFAGYGQYFNDFYLAAEVFANDSGASTTTTAVDSDTVFGTTTLSSKIQAQGSYGIAILPGYRLNPASLFYIRLGYTEAYFKGQESVSSTGFNTSYNNSTWRGGFAYGLGMESTFYPNWSVRGEYTHTGYNSFNNNLNSNVQSSFTPSDNQFMLGLIYHFA